MSKKYASLNTLSIFLDNLRKLFATKIEVDEKSKVQIVTEKDTENTEEHIPTLKIYKLTQEQYNEKLASGNINKDALYLTPEEINYTMAEIDEMMAGKSNTDHTHSIDSIDNLQSVLNSKVPINRTINGKSLSNNINLSASDVGAASTSHNHNDEYYTEVEIDNKLANKSNIGHNHDTDYEKKGAISNHNVSNSAHNDIRLLIQELTTDLNNFLDVDDTTKDQLSELIALIQANANDIETITSGKVNVSDIINNLTTNVANKPLSAAQGVEIKLLIDTLQEELDGHTHASSDIDGLDTVLANKVNLDTFETVSESKSDKLHIHPYGVCTSGEGWTTKIVTVENFSLEEGVRVVVKFENANTASSPKLNINDTGAIPIMRYGSTAVGGSPMVNSWVAGAVVAFTYDGTNWVQDYWYNTTYTNESLGQGCGTCYTTGSTTEKIVDIYRYTKTTGGVVSVKFTYSVSNSATMNINSNGAAPIYYRGSAITNDIIKGGDVATFIYDGSRYHLISIDRWHEDIAGLQLNDSKVRQVLASANSNYPLLLGNYFQNETTTGYTYFDSGVYLNPSNNTIHADIDGNAVGLKNLIATINELNYMSGVTSSVQNQIDTKIQMITWEEND